MKATDRQRVLAALFFVLATMYFWAAAVAHQPKSCRMHPWKLRRDHIFSLAGGGKEHAPLFDKTICLLIVHSCVQNRQNTLVTAAGAGLMT